MKVLKRALELSHEYVTDIIKEGDIVIDCTAGNGNDTLFLAARVGVSGKVYSFDIQETAINNTRNKLAENNLLSLVELVHDSHQNIDQYVNDSIKCAMYNLGYLPNGDHNIVTRSETTIYSLDKVLNLLCVGGIVTIAIYYGHKGGLDEKNAIFDYVQKLDQSYFVVQKIEFMNMINEPPILIIIERIG